MLEVCLFGVTRVEDRDRGEVLTDFHGVKPRQVLEILALAHGQPVGKASLADQLWDGRPPATYTATLESHVSVVRRLLTRAGVPRDALRTVNGGYVLTDAIAVDLTEVTTALGSVREDTSQANLRRVEAQLSRTGQCLLRSSPDATWAARARERLDAHLAEACRRAAQATLRYGDSARAVGLLQRALEAAPLSDVTEQMLILALSAAGARSDALVSFAQFRSRLRDELGVEPDTRTHEVYLAVLRNGPERVEGWCDSERAALSALLAQLPPAGPRRPSVDTPRLVGLAG